MKIIFLFQIIFCFSFGISKSESLNVTELIGHIRQNTWQKQIQVQEARDFVSVYQWFSFNQAVVLVDNYQRFVIQEQEKFRALKEEVSNEGCLESLPKPLYSILKAADWNIEMCIGHIAIYGRMHVEDFEGQLNRFHGNASLYPFDAIKDYFLSPDWASEEGIQAMIELLTDRMRHWDNVDAVNLFNLKTNARQHIQSMVNYEWTLCINHGQNEVKKHFDAAIDHLRTCGKVVQINN